MVSLRCLLDIWAETSDRQSDRRGQNSGKRFRLGIRPKPRSASSLTCVVAMISQWAPRLWFSISYHCPPRSYWRGVSKIWIDCHLLKNLRFPSTPQHGTHIYASNSPLWAPTMWRCCTSSKTNGESWRSGASQYLCMFSGSGLIPSHGPLSNWLILKFLNSNAILLASSRFAPPIRTQDPSFHLCVATYTHA